MHILVFRLPWLLLYGFLLHPNLALVTLFLYYRRQNSLKTKGKLLPMRDMYFFKLSYSYVLRDQNCISLRKIRKNRGILAIRSWSTGSNWFYIHSLRRESGHYLEAPFRCTKYILNVSESTLFVLIHRLKNWPSAIRTRSTAYIIAKEW